LSPNFKTIKNQTLEVETWDQSKPKSA